MAQLTVPTLEGPQIKSQAFGGNQSIQTNVDQFGGAEARVAGNAAKALDQASQVAENIFLQEQKKSDDIALLNYEQKRNEWEEKNVRPFFSEKGVSTEGGANRILKDYDEQDKVLLSALPDRLRTRAGNSSMAARRRIGGNTTRHESQQMDNYLTEMHSSRVNNAINNAANSYTDPKAVSQARTDIISSLQALQKKQGWSENKYNQEKLKSISSLHRKTVDLMVKDGKDLAAKDYLHDAEKNKELTADDLKALKGLVKEENTRVETQNVAKSIWDRSNGDITKAYDMARKELSGETLDLTLVRLDRLEKENNIGDKKFALNWVNKNTANTIDEKYALKKKARETIADPNQLALVEARINVDIENLEKQEISRVRTQAPAIAAQIRGTQGEDFQPQDIEEQVAEAQSLGPRMRKEVIRILKEFEAVRLSAVRTDQAAAYKEAVGLVESGGWQNVPANLRQRLSAEQTRALQNGRIKFDADLYAKYNKMIVDHDAGSDEFLGYEFENDQGKMPDSIIQQMMKLQTTFNTKDPAKVRDARMVSKAYQEAGRIAKATLAPQMTGKTSTNKYKNAKAQIEVIKGHMMEWSTKFLEENKGLQARANYKQLYTQEIYQQFIRGEVDANEIFGDDRSDDMITHAQAIQQDKKNFTVDFEDPENRDEIAKGFGVREDQVLQIRDYLKNRGLKYTIENIKVFIAAAQRPR